MITSGGFLCGIGSMLIASRLAGFHVVGNIEHRSFCNTPTFESNFDAKTFNPKKQNIDHSIFENLDLAVGHPSCGSFSNLNTRKYAGKSKGKPSEVFEFIEYVKQYGPRFFIMDNLAKSLSIIPISYWKNELGSHYDLFPEWVSNWGYGNIQKNRKRLFIIGAHKDEQFIFTPGEREHFTNGGGTIRSVIDDLPPFDVYDMNHVHYPNEAPMIGWGSHMLPITQSLGYIQMKHVKQTFKDYPVGKNFWYYNKQGEKKRRPAVSKIDIDRPSKSIYGGGDKCQFYRSDTMHPLTIRERARIQGVPDDFIFHPLNFIESHGTYNYVIKQLGKFIPIQAVQFMCEQIKAHIEDKPFEASGNRLLKPNPLVDHAKQMVCNCRSHRETCWLKKTCIFS